MYMIVWAIIMMIVSYAIQMMMQKPPPSQKPGQFDIPTAEEGGVIPVAFGRVRAKTPNVIWSGDQRSTPIRKKGGKK
jgi:hypothetical protein